MKWIIARYKEDISWSKDLDSFVVQKGEHLENKGREPSSYLWYIINNYYDLSGYYTFTQGNPLPHAQSIVTEAYNGSEEHFKWLGCTEYTDKLDGSPHDTCNIDWFIKEIGLDYNKDTITFKGGCQFTVSAERIKRRPLEWYKKVFSILMTEQYRCPWSFERCVGLIFGGE